MLIYLNKTKSRVTSVTDIEKIITERKEICMLNKFSTHLPDVHNFDFEGFTIKSNQNNNMRFFIKDKKLLIE